MFSKLHPQSATDPARRRYDIPGASLHGPYTLWIPKAENHQSESENEGPRLVPSTSNRPHVNHLPATHVVASSNGNTAAMNGRQQNVAPIQHIPSNRQKQRTDRIPLGYSSESTVHTPADSSKPSSSFNFFKSHSKDSRGPLASIRKREENTRPSKFPSRQATPQPVPRKAVSRNFPVEDQLSASPSTLSSADPSPRSSMDSGSRDGHISAPSAGHSGTKKQGHSIWNPYVDARMVQTSTYRRNDPAAVQPRWDDKKAKDKEDMVAKVTEALGGGSIGKAKELETAMFHDKAQTGRRDDAGKKGASITGTRVAEAPSYSQPQIVQHHGRYKSAPQTTSSANVRPENFKSSHLSASTRNNIEVPSRPHGIPEPSDKASSPRSKPPVASPSKLSHPRSAFSPWPFNQALPPEQMMSHVKPQAYSSSWKSSGRPQVTSTTTTYRTTDLHPSKELSSHSTSHGHTTSHGLSNDIGRNSQQISAPSAPLQQSTKSSARGTVQASQHTLATSSSAMSTTVPVSPPPSAQARTNPVTSAESHRWSPNTVTTSKPAGDQNGHQQSHGMSQTALATISSKNYEAGRIHPSTPDPGQGLTPSMGKRHPADGTESNATIVASNTLEQSHMSISTAEHGTAYPTTAKQRHTAEGLYSNGTGVLVSPTTTHRAVASLNVGIQSQGDARTTSKHLEQRSDNSSPKGPTLVSSSRLLSASTPEVPVQADVMSPTTRNNLPMSPRSPEGVIAAQIIAAETPSNATRRIASNPPTSAETLAMKSVQESYPVLDYGVEDTTNGSIYVPTHQGIYTEIRRNSPNESRASGSSTPEKVTSGAWTTYEVVPVQKSSPKNLSSDNMASAASRHSSVTPNASNPPVPTEVASRSLRHATANIAPTNQQTTVTPGAWTTSTRYGVNTLGSIFDSSPAVKNLNASAREASPPQATLGTKVVAGAWTTKKTSGSGTSSSSEATVVKSTPVSQTPTTINTQVTSKPSPTGTNTGSSTPSSTQTSDLVNQLSTVTSYSISTRVPISGHPSTPAPARPTLRETPPPLSISSTLPDTDSLLTPSSLNSPQSMLSLPPSRPVSTVTGVETVDQPNVPRKVGFFDFLRPKPSAKSYEVWMPPKPPDKDRTRDEQTKDRDPSPQKTKPSVPVQIPQRPKSPKFFSPFKLFARRHRTVSSASLDVQDGTAPNTVMNSPASSMRAETPGAPPSPPIRDALLATQEWRNREARELMTSGRKRRPRPGVTFDCPEERAPIDIMPSRLRIGRMRNDDDDDDYL